MAVFTISGKDWLRGLNSIQGDASNLDEFNENYNEYKESTNYKNHKAFDNLGDISDEQLGTESPIIQLGLCGINLNDVDRQHIISDSRNQAEYVYSYGYNVNYQFNSVGEKRPEVPFEIKPSDNIGEFDRVAMYLPIPSSMTFRKMTYTSVNGFPLYGYNNFPINDFTCRKIKNGNIVNVPLRCYFGENDLTQINNEFGLRYHIQLRGKEDERGRSDVVSPLSFRQGMPFDTQYDQTTNVVGSNQSNVWIFNSQSDCDEYLRTGNYTKAINYNSDYIPPIVDGRDNSDAITYYWNQRAFTKNSAKGGKTYIDNLSFNFYVTLVNTYHRTLAVENNYTQQEISDCELFINNSQDIIEVYYKAYNDDDYEIKSINFLQTLQLIWRDVRRMNRTQYSGLYLGAEVSTNIPVFSHGGDAEKFFDDEIDDGGSKNADDLNDYKDRNKNGDSEKEQSELNEISTINNLSQLIECSNSFVTEFANFLASDTQTMQEILTGLSLRGANPISFIVDFFALPFTLNEFRDVQANTDMYFGNYRHTFSNSYNLIIRNNRLKNVFSTFITPIYNDWRDYLTNVYIYLPFVNIQPLQYEEIVNKTLSCQVGVDIATGTIKYYLRSNGVVIQTFEGCVRQTMPISSNDSYSASMNKIGGASQILQALPSTATSIATGNVGGVVGGVGGLFGGGMDILKQTPHATTGNYSSATAFFDELNTYLIYEQTNVLYGDNIKEQYNLPDNRVGYLNSCNGYTVIDDIELNISASEDIRNDIKTLLSNGVYI